MKNYVLLIIICLLVVGCVPPNKDVQARIDECMKQGRVPTYIGTMQAVVFRCDMPGEQSSIELNTRTAE